MSPNWESFADESLKFKKSSWYGTVQHLHFKIHVARPCLVHAGILTTQCLWLFVALMPRDEGGEGDWATIWEDMRYFIILSFYLPFLTLWGGGYGVGRGGSSGDLIITMIESISDLFRISDYQSMLRAQVPMGMHSELHTYSIWTYCSRQKNIQRKKLRCESSVVGVGLISPSN